MYSMCLVVCIRCVSWCIRLVVCSLCLVVYSLYLVRLRLWRASAFHCSVRSLLRVASTPRGGGFALPTCATLTVLVPRAQVLSKEVAALNADFFEKKVRVCPPRVHPRVLSRMAVYRCSHVTEVRVR